MRALLSVLVALSATLLAGCSVRYGGDLTDCTADADCQKLKPELVCDRTASLCVKKACAATSECAALSPALVCDDTHLCAAKACAAHADCAAFGDEYACSHGTCTNACAPAAFSAADAASNLKLAAVLPLSTKTGDENAAVRVRRWSIELGLKEVNEERGGIQVGSGAARKISVDFCDTFSDPALAARLAKHVVDSHAAILTAGTAESQQVLAVAKPKNVLVMSVSATANSLTVTDAGPVDNRRLFWRTAPRDEFQGIAIRDELLRHSDREGTPPRIGVAYENNDYGNGLAKVIGAKWPVSSVSNVPFDPGSPATAPLGDLNAASPAYVVFAAAAANSAVLLKQMQNQTNLKAGRIIPFFSDSSTNQTVVDQLVAQGVDTAVLQAAVGTIVWVPASEEFGTYRSNYGLLRSSPRGGSGYVSFDKEGTFGAQTYDAFYSLALAAGASLTSTRNPDGVLFSGSTLAAGLAQLNVSGGKEITLGSAGFATAMSAFGQGSSVNITGVSGGLDFDENGDVSGVYALCKFGGTPLAFSVGDCNPLP
jgi:branched-chain amino acid transport system substrate-binding protein